MWSPVPRETPCRALTGVLGLALALQSVTAEASPLTPAPSPERFAVWGGLAYFTDNSQHASALHVASHNFGAAYALDPRWSVSLEWGLVGLHSTSDAAPAETVVVIGNPTAFGWYSLAAGETQVRLGLGATFPAATVDAGGGGRLERSAYTHANAMDGHSRVWLWAPSRTSVLVRGESITPLASWLTLSAAVTPALFVPAWSDFVTQRVDFMAPAQLGLSASYQGFELGSRLQAVWMPTSTLDPLQLSVEPGVGFATKDVRVGAYGTINLDEPLAGARGPRIWGLHLTLDVRL
jgi:hypothetical protein